MRAPQKKTAADLAGDELTARRGGRTRKNTSPRAEPPGTSNLQFGQIICHLFVYFRLDLQQIPCLTHVSRARLSQIR